MISSLATTLRPGSGKGRVRMHRQVYEAAKSGDYGYLVSTISGNGEDLFHQTTARENNILHVATQHKQVNFVEHLLQFPSGQSLLWQGNYLGETPLHIAATLGSYKTIQVFTDLVKSLHWVIENGEVDACKELLRKPNLREDTALHYAVRGGHAEVVKLLIEEDPQLCDISNAAKESPLYLATERGLLRITELILGASSLSSSQKGPKGFTPLHVAARSLPIWRKILEKRPEMIRIGDDVGWTPLHYVTCEGKCEVVRLLLQYDTSLAYDTDKEGQSALHVAASLGHLHVIEEIVGSCPDAWDILNIKGQTALHAAAVDGRLFVVKRILQTPNLKYLINKQDTNGNTALHLATFHKRYHIIYMLARDKRVDRFATNNDHRTATDIFWAHREVGYSAAKVEYMSEGSDGMSLYEDLVIRYMKSLGNKGQLALTRTSIKGIAKRQLLVATLIATVTLVAGRTISGGYNNDGPNQGMAVLANRTALYAFQIINFTALYFSVLSVVLLYTRFQLDNHQKSYISIAGKCIFIAILGMVLAFFCGTYAVLKKPLGST